MLESTTIAHWSPTHARMAGPGSKHGVGIAARQPVPDLPLLHSENCSGGLSIITPLLTASGSPWIG